MLEILLAFALGVAPVSKDVKYSSTANEQVYVVDQEELDSLFLEIEKQNKLIKEEFLQTLKDQEQIRCMATAVYFEARGEPRLGRLGVLNVIYNRVKDSRFPNSACKVVYQKTPRRGGGRICQFSWACKPHKVYHANLYEKSIELATEFYYNSESWEDPTNGSNFFHAKTINPNWPYKRTISLGGHVFYKG